MPCSKLGGCGVRHKLLQVFHNGWSRLQRHLQWSTSTGDVNDKAIIGSPFQFALCPKRRQRMSPDAPTHVYCPPPPSPPLCSSRATTRTRLHDQLNKSGVGGGGWGGRGTKAVSFEPIFIDPQLINFEQGKLLPTHPVRKDCFPNAVRRGLSK